MGCAVLSNFHLFRPCPRPYCRRRQAILVMFRNVKPTLYCALAALASFTINASAGTASSQKEVAPPPVEAEEEPLFNGILSVAWDSAFVCEGRDFVREGDLVSTYLLINASNGLGLWLWAADSVGTPFAEVDIGLQYSRMIGDFDLGFGWSTGHDYQYDDNFTEAYTWVYYRKYSWLVPGARWKYGDFSGGTYLELSLASEYTCLDGKLTFTPSAILGIDFGYATEDVDGYNNVQLMLAASYALTDTLSLSGYVAHSIGLEDVENTGDEDLTWGGVSLTVAF